jgi:peptide/nickel transport system permease protein
MGIKEKGDMKDMGEANIALRQTKRKTQVYEVYKRFKRNSLAMTGSVVLIILVAMAIFAPIIAPYDYAALDMSDMHAVPSLKHWFGTDQLGRDILSRIIYGAQYSLSLGVLTMLVSNVIGIICGSLAGYFGGRVDNIILRFIDILQSIPGMLLAVVVSTVLGSGYINTVIAMSIGGIPMVVRLLRASILRIRKEEYLEAAASVNCSTFRIMGRYVFPNSYSSLLVSASMGIGNTIMGAAGLSYIGLGIQPPMAEWGALLSGARGYIRDSPHEIIFPGLFIMITVLAFNLIGDGLRDAMDPKLKH